MASLDLLFRGGPLIDDTGAPGRAADVDVPGCRILAVGDPPAVDLAGRETGRRAGHVPRGAG